MRRRVLVTAISGDIANGILHIIRDYGADFIVGTDINEYAVGMDQVDVFHQCRLAVEEGYVDEIVALCRQYRITHLIPVNEREIEVLSQGREKFAEMNVKMVVQTPKVLSVCLDKLLTVQSLEAAGVDVPAIMDWRTGAVSRFGEGYIIKLRKSNGSRGIRRVDAVGECAEGEIIQEYVPGDEYTVGMFSDGTVTNVIKFKRQLKNGMSYLVELSHDESIEATARTVAQALDLRGYVNVQLRKFNGRNYVFEVNPRISGTVRFRHMLGFCDVLWWLDYLDGISVPAYADVYERAIGIRELQDKYLIKVAK